MKNFAKSMLLFAFAALLTTLASAETQGAHPAYLRALSNLRYARAHVVIYLNNQHPEADESRAVHAIDAAINIIKEAAIDDGKNLDDHPVVDESMERTKHYHQAIRVLDAAYRDINQHESSDFARDLKGRALGEINEARRVLHHAENRADAEDNRCIPCELR